MVEIKLKNGFWEIYNYKRISKFFTHEKNEAEIAEELTGPKSIKKHSRCYFRIFKKLKS